MSDGLVNVQVDNGKDDIPAAANRIQTIIATATRLAFKDLAADIQSKVRAEIAGAGFKGRWVTGFRTYVFPKTEEFTYASINQLTVRGFHSYNIANVFERGANIAGKPLLWIPLNTCPPKVRGKSTTPARLIEAGVRLHKITQGGRTLLIGNIIRPGARSKRGRTLVKRARGRFSVDSGQVSVAQLLNAQRNIRRTQVKRAFGAPVGFQTVSIPLFIGLSAVELKRKFNASAIYEKGRAELASYYYRRVGEVIARGANSV